MEKVCLGKYTEHNPIIEVYTTRFISGGELYENDTEYMYCERCKMLLEHDGLDDQTADIYNEIPY